MLHAVVMAGGTGTRFWPESRTGTPKQLLALVDQRSMLRTTVDRLAGLVPPERTLVVTNKNLVPAVIDQLPELPPESILGEPCKRDTAPCIGLAAMEISRRDPDATMVVMPADHVIETDAQFRAAIEHAAALVDQSPERIVTLGIVPTYAAESFGYIERGAPLAGDTTAYRAKSFREKPAAETARQFIESGDFYWNAGIFVWRADTILAALAQHQPEMHAHLVRIADAHDTPAAEEVFEREFTAIRGVSIDFAVLEHAADIAVVPAPFRWDDLGSWQALARLRGTDARGNTATGPHVAIDTHDSIIRTTGDHLVAALGLRDLVIVHTPDATLIANKHDEESVRQLVKMLGEKGWTQYL